MFFRHMGKARRDVTVEACIRKAVASGKDHAVFDDLAFSAAHSYAIDHGALAPERDAASTRFAEGGTTYFVVFIRATRGGTIINAEDERLVTERVQDRDKMEAHLHKSIMNDLEALSREERYDRAERLTVKDIQDEVVKVPSWGLDEVRMRRLISATTDAAIRSGMNETLAVLWLRQQDVLAAVLTSAAQFEIAGFTQSEQVDCACAFTEKLAKAQLKAQARRRA